MKTQLYAGDLFGPRYFDIGPCNGGWAINSAEGRMRVVTHFKVLLNWDRGFEPRLVCYGEHDRVADAPIMLGALNLTEPE